MNRVLVFCALISLAFFPGCTTSDAPAPKSRYQLVKVFDDKINEILNSNYKIAASNERYYMIFQASVYNDFRSILLVTDLAGDVVNRDTLPSGMTISDVMALDDGSALVAGYMGCCPNLNIFHYDKNVNLLSSNSLYIPGIDLLSFYGSPQLRTSHNGNILVYGNYFNSTGGSPCGYVAEVDFGGNVLWSNKISLQISSCVATSDLGYFFASYAADTLGGMDVYIVKTNSTGDSLLAKKIKEHSVRGNIGNVVHTARDSYQINYTEEWPSYKSTIYESNVHGDSMKAVTFDNTRLAWLTARNDGSTLLLLAPYAFATGDAVTVRKSTKFVTVDASLTVLERFTFQDVTTDFVLSTCSAPGGRVACFGVIQSFKNDYYNPVLIVLND